MHRRKFLRSAGVVGSLAVAGCSRSGDERERQRRYNSTGPPDPISADAVDDQLGDLAAQWGLDDVVNLAAEGADTTGGDAFNDVFESVADDGTLVYLPSGDYNLEDSISLGSNLRFGLVGEGATITPPDGFSDPLFAFGYPEPMQEISVRGVEFDFTAQDTGGRPIFAAASDRVHLEDVSVTGEIDTNEDQIRIDVTDRDGTGHVERLELPDGAAPGTNVTGCEVGDGNRGDLSFVDCHIEGFTDNGLYADPPVGSVTVEGGFYKNNGISSVRIQTSEASVARGVHVVCDDRESDYDNMRGIRLRAGKSLLVEDCVVEMLSVSSSDGAVTFASELESATVRNCRLHVDADGVNAIRVKSPVTGESSETVRGPFRCENIAITGSAAGGAAIVASNRDGCDFRNLCVHQSGSDRNGLEATNVNGQLSDSTLAVTGDPIFLENSTFERRNVSTTRRPNEDGACELPDE